MLDNFAALSFSIFAAACILALADALVILFLKSVRRVRARRAVLKRKTQ